MSALLTATGLAVALSGRTVFSEVNLEIQAGETLGLVGASGSGKSTLLRALGALQPLAAGRLAFDGVDLVTLGPRAYRRQVSFIAQRPAMAPGTVADNLALGPAFRGTPPGDAQSSLQRVGLSVDLAARDAKTLSGGEQFRCALARALALAPRLLLLDEPTAALDAAAADGILALLYALAAEGLGLVVVTHDERALRVLPGRRLRLAEARLVAA